MEEDDTRKTPPFRPPQPATISHATAPAAMEADEEERMEKFYELISNLKVLSGIWKSEAPRKRVKSESVLWKPTFEWEDFAGGSDGLCSPPRREEDGRKKRRKEEVEGGEAESICDLKLGL